MALLVFQECCQSYTTSMKFEALITRFISRAFDPTGTRDDKFVPNRNELSMSKRAFVKHRNDYYILSSNATKGMWFFIAY